MSTLIGWLAAVSAAATIAPPSQPVSPSGGAPAAVEQAQATAGVAPAAFGQRRGPKGFTWVPSRRGKKWTNEVVGGREGSRRLVICRAQHAGGKHPGKRVAGKCNFGYGGREIEAVKYDVLVAGTANPRWSSTSNQIPAAGAFIAGRYDGRPGHVCRAMHQGSMHPGKVVAGNCNIGYGGKEIIIRRYQTLLDPTYSPPAPPVVAKPPVGIQPQVAPVMNVKPQVSQLQRCKNAVQGKIAYDYKNNRRWAEKNLNDLCRNGRGRQPAKCFRRVMHGNVNWGGGTQWKWANALNLCGGAQDADRVIKCFKRKVKRGRTWQKAIKKCKGR